MDFYDIDFYEPTTIDDGIYQDEWENEFGYFSQRSGVVVLQYDIPREIDRMDADDLMCATDSLADWIADRMNEKGDLLSSHEISITFTIGRLLATITAFGEVQDITDQVQRAVKNEAIIERYKTRQIQEGLQW